MKLRRVKALARKEFVQMTRDVRALMGGAAPKRARKAPAKKAPAKKAARRKAK